MNFEFFLLIGLLNVHMWLIFSYEMGNTRLFVKKKRAVYTSGSPLSYCLFFCDFCSPAASCGKFYLQLRF